MATKTMVRLMWQRSRRVVYEGNIEANQLMYTLQNALPESWGSGGAATKRYAAWLDKWKPELLRFIELKSVEQVGDFLGLQEAMLRRWVEAQGVVIEPKRQRWGNPKMW